MRKCKICEEEKDIEKFVKRSKNKDQNHISPLYTYECKRCFNKRRRKSDVIRNEKGHFLKGTQSGRPFQKGHEPWSKKNKGKYHISNGGMSRSSYNYKTWKEDVKKRDNYMCVRCSETEKLHVHHILDYKNYPEKRFDLNNGMTLCIGCHNHIEKKGKKSKLNHDSIQ